MGYACPVCETPQADGRHLANHIAFTAMIHGDDHEAWLAEHAPGWEEAGERELAGRVVECATETEFPPGSGEATDEQRGAGSRDRSHEHGHGGLGHGDHDHDRDSHSDRRERRPDSDRSGPGSTRVAIDSDLGGDSEDDRGVAAVVAEARELTRRMYDESEPKESGRKDAPERESEPDRDEDEGGDGDGDGGEGDTENGIEPGNRNDERSG